MTTEPTGPASKAALRSARRLLSRKGRDETGQLLAEGPQAVREALAAGLVERTFAIDSAVAKYPELTGGAALVSDAELASIAGTDSPQGLVAVCRRPMADLGDVLGGSPRLVVVCAEVRDPGNAGTVIRCADAFGADAVLMSPGSVDIANPKTVRASVGSVFHLPIVTGIEVAEGVRELQAAGLCVLAADGAGSAGLDELAADGTLAGPVAFLLGNEAWGLPVEVAALADRVVRIPMWGRAESLNLATAAAVCLYTTAAAQRKR